MEASDLVDFLLKEDDDSTLSVEYEVQRMPWQTTGGSNGYDRSKRKTVGAKRCSDLSQAEMDELLRDLEQLIIRPRRDRDVEITVRDSGSEEEVSKGRHKDQKEAKNGRKKNKRQPSSKKNDNNLDVTQTGTVPERRKTDEGKNKTLYKRDQGTVSIHDNNLKTSKPRKSRRKVLEFDTRNEEADPTEIEAVIREQQIESPKHQSNKVSQTKDKPDKSLRNGGKEHNNFSEEVSPTIEKDVETTKAAKSILAKKKRSKRNKNKEEKTETKAKEKSDLEPDKSNVNTASKSKKKHRAKPQSKTSDPNHLEGGS